MKPTPVIQVKSFMNSSLFYILTLHPYPHTTQDNCMSVCLCDTSTEDDVYINDCLYDQGLALLSAEGGQASV